MDELIKNVKIILGENPDRKYYVYRLVDPRTLQTFYIGKGCDDRVFQHVRGTISLMSLEKDEDEMSLKTQQIAEILSAGKEVIAIIHRRGLTNNEALEVEAALIDAYPGLTNIQRGYGFERGAMTVEDLYATYNIPVYNEPTEKYVIIKTTPKFVNDRNGLYNAVRLAWHAKLDTAKKYKYILAVVDGIVREVYKVREWYQFNNDRIGFHGEPTSDSISSLVKNKRIPDYYKKRGAANPFMYKKK